MKVFKEDWSQESQPLYKSKEPKGKEVSSATCPLCKKQVVTVDGKLATHSCKTDK